MSRIAWTESEWQTIFASAAKILADTQGAIQQKDLWEQAQRTLPGARRRTIFGSVYKKLRAQLQDWRNRQPQTADVPPPESPKHALVVFQRPDGKCIGLDARFTVSELTRMGIEIRLADPNTVFTLLKA